MHILKVLWISPLFFSSLRQSSGCETVRRWCSVSIYGCSCCEKHAHILTHFSSSFFVFLKIMKNIIVKAYFRNTGMCFFFFFYLFKKKKMLWLFPLMSGSLATSWRCLHCVSKPSKPRPLSIWCVKPTHSKPSGIFHQKPQQQHLYSSIRVPFETNNTSKTQKGTALLFSIWYKIMFLSRKSC